MGYQTVFMILNDAGHLVKQNQEQVIQNINEAMSGVRMHREQSRDFSIGYHSSAMKAFQAQHADIPQVFLAHGNDLVRLGYGSDLTEEKDLKYRKECLKVIKNMVKREEEIIKEMEAKIKEKQ